MSLLATSPTRGGAPVRLDAAEVAAAAADLEGRHPRDALAWALERFSPERTIIVTALQTGGMAAVDMALQIDPRARVATIDTGRLPEETHEYLDTVREHFAHRVEVVLPQPEAVGRFVAEHGANSFYSSVERRLDCCSLRKVEPLTRLLEGADCWVTGLMRSSSASRKATPIVELDAEHGGIVKVNPVAAWDDATTRAYLAERGVPLHPLYALGYTSIGCAPCTRAIAPGEHPRSGRWWWELGVAKECGLHRRPAGSAA